MKTISPGLSASFGIRWAFDYFLCFEMFSGGLMVSKPTYDEMKQKIAELEREVSRLTQVEKALRERDEQLNDMRQELESTNHQFETVVQRTNQMAIETEIASLELNQIFNTAADGMWVIDNAFNVQRINDTFLRILEKSREEVVGRKCYDLLSNSICRGSKCALNQLRNGLDRFECDIEHTDGGGTATPMILTATPFLGLDGELIGIVGSLKDITERKQAEEALQKANKELERLAAVDGLTQIGNRRRFDEYLDREWKRQRRDKKWLSLILCDIDVFKLYNDHYGHLSGDDCLKAVAQSISANVKRPADLVARYGGEEFAVILPDTDATGAIHVAENIREGVKNLNIVHEKSSVCPYVTLSLGVSSVVPPPESSPEVLVKSADDALYEAKKNGRDRVVLKKGDS